MGEKDTLTKRFMSRPEVFADAFNYLMYEGEPVIDPKNLTELDTASLAVTYSENAKRPVQKVRDVLKEWVCMTDDKMAYMILGVENQTHIHYAMPVRNMLYDAIQYENQVKKTEREKKRKKHSSQPSAANDSDGEYLCGFGKEDKLKPVVTLVVYFGDKEWDAPTSLYEMFGAVDRRTLAFVPDYQINLICPATAEPKKLEKLASDFREAMTFIKYAADGDKLLKALRQDPKFHTMDKETVFMLNQLTGTKIEITESEEKVDMCAAIQNLMDKSEAQGIVKGRAEGMAKGRAEGKAEERAENMRGFVEILRSYDIPDSDIFDKIKSKYHLSDEEAEAYMKPVEA